MKKTLTINLGGTVYHIDEDAYHLLDNYLANLRIHFRREEGAEEIVHDMELRISELFADRLNEGKQVITIEDVEEIIARMGKPENSLVKGMEKHPVRKRQKGPLYAVCFVIRTIKCWVVWLPDWPLIWDGMLLGYVSFYWFLASLFMG